MEEFSSVQALQERALVIRQKLASSVSRNCFLCGQPGHLRTNCPQPCNFFPSRTRSGRQYIRKRALVIKQKLASSVSRNCFLCGQPRHLRDKCPQDINLCPSRTRSGKQYIRICKTCHTPGHINHKIVKKTVSRSDSVQPKIKI